MRFGYLVQQVPDKIIGTTEEEIGKLMKLQHLLGVTEPNGTFSGPSFDALKKYYGRRVSSVELANNIDKIIAEIETNPPKKGWSTGKKIAVVGGLVIGGLFIGRAIQNRKDRDEGVEGIKDWGRRQQCAHYASRYKWALKQIRVWWKERDQDIRESPPEDEKMIRKEYARQINSFRKMMFKNHTRASKAGCTWQKAKPKMLHERG